MDKFEKVVNQAFDVLAKEEYERRAKDIPKHTFSLRFRCRMFREVRALKKKKRESKKDDDSHAHAPVYDLYRPLPRKRTAWLVLLIVLVIGGTALAAGPLLRWLYNRYVSQREDHVEIMNREEEGNHREKGFRKYRISEVPEGYELNTDDFNLQFQKYQATYSNVGGNVLYIRQYWKEDVDLGRMTADGRLLEEIGAEGFTGYFLEGEDMRVLVFTDGVYLMELGGNLSEEELLAIVDGLELEDEPAAAP